MSTPKINPNYYAIIPASVRYDNELPSTAKLLYGEIASLSNLEGFCWASNTYFGKLYEISSRNVSVLISKLEERGHIRTEIESNTGNTRNIYLVGTIDKNINRYGKKYHDPIDKNIKHNNKTNTKKNTISAESKTSGPEKDSEVYKIYHLYLSRFKVTDTIDRLQASKRYKLTDKRRAAIQRRLDDAGFKVLAASIVGYSQSDWHTGTNDRGWIADLEQFICRSYENVEKGANLYAVSKQTKKTNDPWS